MGLRKQGTFFLVVPYLETNVVNPCHVIAVVGRHEYGYGVDGAKLCDPIAIENSGQVLERYHHKHLSSGVLLERMFNGAGPWHRQVQFLSSFCLLPCGKVEIIPVDVSSGNSMRLAPRGCVQRATSLVS
jgi:hypothetical protein